MSSWTPSGTRQAGAGMAGLMVEVFASLVGIGIILMILLLVLVNPPQHDLSPSEDIQEELEAIENDKLDAQRIAMESAAQAARQMEEAELRRVEANMAMDQAEMATEALQLAEAQLRAGREEVERLELELARLKRKNAAYERQARSSADDAARRDAELAAAQGELERLEGLLKEEQQRAARSNAAQALATSYGGVRTREIRVVIAVDTSASMGPHHDRLNENAITMADVISPLAPLAVGIVAYRSDQAVFDLSPIVPVGVDGGASLNSLKRFVGGLSPEHSFVDLPTAVHRSLDMLRAPGNPDGSSTLVILTDVSINEIDGDHALSDTEARAGEQLISTVRAWASGPQRRKVVVVYTGDTSHPANQAHREYLQRLATEANGTYSENPGGMLAELLRGAVVTD